MSARILAPILVGCVLMLLGGYVQGTWTDRWSQSRTQLLNSWVEHLDLVPLSVGDWDGQPMEASSEEVKRVARFAGERPIAFKNRRTGQEVYMILMVGKSRNVAMHTPDKCMPAQGFNLGEKMSHFKVDYGDKQADFYTSLFHKESSDTETVRQRILWAWNDGTGWQAPDYPKLTFGGSPALYKLYLITQLERNTDQVADSPTVAFAREFLPMLDQALFNQAAAGAAVNTDSGAAAPATETPAPASP